jgi:hypothetical protein
MGWGRQQHTLHQAEDRRGRANAERQREHGDDGESGLLPQFSLAKSHVVKHWRFLAFFWTAANRHRLSIHARRVIWYSESGVRPTRGILGLLESPLKHARPPWRLCRCGEI